MTKVNYEKQEFIVWSSEFDEEHTVSSGKPDVQSIFAKGAYSKCFSHNCPLQVDMSWLQVKKWETWTQVAHTAKLYLVMHVFMHMNKVLYLPNTQIVV